MKLRKSESKNTRATVKRIMTLLGKHRALLALSLLCAAVSSDELILKLVFPRENEVLFTYSLIDEEYVGAMANAEMANPIAAARNPARAISHARRHNVFTT